jgi:hypothetical protein
VADRDAPPLQPNQEVVVLGMVEPFVEAARLLEHVAPAGEHVRLDREQPLAVFEDAEERTVDEVARVGSRGDQPARLVDRRRGVPGMPGCTARARGGRQTIRNR